METTEVATKTGTGWTYTVATCGLLAGMLGAGQVDLRSRNSQSLGRHVRGNSGTKYSHLGMKQLGAAGSGEVKTCRGGDVVEAGAEAILNELGPKQPAYILNWVARVTRCTLARVEDG